MFQLVGTCVDLQGQDSGQEGVVAGDSSNFSDSGDRPISGDEFVPILKDSMSGTLGRKGKRGGFTTKPLWKGILDDGVLCSYTEHRVEKGG